MPHGRRPVAEVLCDPARAHVYEHGWQSRSPAGRYPVTGQPPRPRLPDDLVVGYRPDRPGPVRGFQGEGLLALETEPGGPARLWAAPRPAAEVPSIRADPGAGPAGRLRLTVSADGEVAESVHPSLAAAVGTWADRAAATAGVAAAPSLAPAWCACCAFGCGDGAGGPGHDELVRELAAMDRLGLDVAVVVLDGAHRSGIGDWRPEPLAALARPVRDGGRRAGARIAPFLVAEGSRLAAEHPGWLVDGADAGGLAGRRLGVLDVTHPGAAGHLRDLVAQLVAAGIDHLVLDALYAGALAGRRHADAPVLAAYREGLRLVREAAGPGCTLVGAAAPLLPSIGLVDAMRTGPGVAPVWAPPGGDQSHASLSSALATTGARTWQHGRLWVSAPGCLLAAPWVGRRRVWAGHLAAAAGAASSGDRPSLLDQAGVELTRRVLRPSSPFPVAWAPDDGPEPAVVALLA